MMAPRFKKNMFYCSVKDGVVTGLIGFHDNAEFQFRDKVVQRINALGKNFFFYKEEGRPTPIDSLVLFFDNQSKGKAEQFFKKKIPNAFHFMFNTRTAKQWSEEWSNVRKEAKAYLETSHDFPCLIITTSIYSQTELSDIIKSAAKELSLEMYENKELEDTRIVMSNRTFDLPKNN